MPRKKRTSTALSKRVKVLEQKQKADDKTQERKVVYNQSFDMMANFWRSATANFLLETAQGTAGSGNVSSVSPAQIRIGNSINLRSARIKIFCMLPSDANGLANQVVTACRCRLLLVDNLTDNTQLTAADVLQNQTYAITSPYKAKVAGGKRYRILGDYNFKLDNATTSKVIDFKMPLPKSGRVVHYDGDLSTIPSDLNVSMFWYCNGIDTTSPNQPSINWFSTARFEDA